MPASTAKFEKDLDSLRLATSTASALIAQLEATKASESTTSSVNALDLAHDTASLIKAHSTKISLLIINKPFTATAVTTVLRELTSGALPGLASAVELCNAANYTTAMSTELQYRAKKVFTELAVLIKKIPLDGQILSNDQKNGNGISADKGSLTMTGLVWEACDELMNLKKVGVAGLMIQKVEQYRALLKDALEEMQDWADEDSDEESDDEGVNDDGEEISAQDAVDNMFASQRHIPSDDPEKIRPRLETSQKRLKLIILLYTALIKRRLKTLPLFPSSQLSGEENASGRAADIVSCLDQTLDVLKTIPDIVDELANSFYELDGAEIDRRMDECQAKGSAVVEVLAKNWKGETDEFTSWSQKFLQEMKRAGT